MTRQPHLKARVRARMAKTGEQYAVARSHVVGPANTKPSTSPGTPPSHLAGSHPESTALRIVSSAAGVDSVTTGTLCADAVVASQASESAAGMPAKAA